MSRRDFVPYPGRNKKLPSQDSNLEKQIQILLCYHYTTGQKVDNVNDYEDWIS